MDTIFMNFENIKTSEPLTGKLDLRRYEKVLLYQILVYTTHGKT